jgi:thioredoxin-related protein
MKKIIATYSLLTTWALLGIAVFAGSGNWSDDYEAALKIAKSEKKLILADFSGSDWCYWCKKIDNEIFSQKEFVSGATNNFVLLLIDSPRNKLRLSEKARKENPALLKKYAIRYFPTVLILDSNGDIITEVPYQKDSVKSYLKKINEISALSKEDLSQLKKLQSDFTGIGNRLDAEQKKIEFSFPDKKSRDKEFFLKVVPKYIAEYENMLAKITTSEKGPELKKFKKELLEKMRRTIAFLKENTEIYKSSLDE